MPTDNREKNKVKEWIKGITPGQVMMSIIGALLTLVVSLSLLVFSGYKKSVDDFGLKVDKLEVTISETNTALETIKENFVIGDKEALKVTSDLRIAVGILQAKVEALEKKR